MHNNEFTRRFRSVIFFADGVLPFLFWFLLIFAFGDICTGILTVIAAAVHEAGHVLYLYLGKGLFALPHAVTCGMKIAKPSSMSYGQELCYAAFGPIFNLIAAFLCFVLFSSGGYTELFAVINLLTALSNLLPIEGYDGYRILYCIFAKSKFCERYFSILSHLSFLFTVLLLFFSLYLMLKFGTGYWIFAIFFASAFSVVRRKLKKCIF